MEYTTYYNHDEKAKYLYKTFGGKVWLEKHYNHGGNMDITIDEIIWENLIMQYWEEKGYLVQLTNKNGEIK